MKKKIIMVLSLIFGFFSVLSIMLSFSIPANAKPWYVRPGERIQNYIDNPDVDSGDEIILERRTYIENIKFINMEKTIILRSIDPNDPNCVADTIIDGNHVDSVVAFYNNVIQNSIISGLTLKNGKGSSCDVSGKNCYGGGIYCYNSSPIIENCIICENGYDDENISVWRGGGICCHGSSPTIRNCIIKGNKATDIGGGICCINISMDHCGGFSPTIEGCYIYDNHSGIGVNDSGSGGGIGSWCSDPSIIKCKISQNEASDGGGGIFLNQSSAKITDCTILLNNTINGRGGGICCLNADSYSKKIEITNCKICKNNLMVGGSFNHGGGIYFHGSSSPKVDKCIINENLAWLGGGIFCTGNAKPKFTNCVIAFNKAYSDRGDNPSGGGIYCYSLSSPTIINSTICFNTAKSRGAGIYCNDPNSSPIITNSILWEDTIDGDPSGIYYAEELYIKDNNSFLTTISYSDIQMPYGEIYGEEEQKNINVDPLFADIMGHLLPYSPCIDANTDPNIVLTDDRDGNPRPQDGEMVKDGVKRYDMGAYEFPSDYVIPDVRLPEYITTHFTATGGDDSERDVLNDSDKKEEGYFNPFYGKDADDRWMNWDKHGYPRDVTKKPSYNNYHNENTCNNEIKVKYDESNNPINDDDNDGIPNEIEAFEQAVFQATGYHCDILNFTPRVKAEKSYLIEDHPNIQIVNNIYLWASNNGAYHSSSLFTVIFPPFWKKDGSYPVLLQCPGFYIDLNAMYLLEDERRFAIWVGQSTKDPNDPNNDGLIVIRSNAGGWETEGYHESAIHDMGSFLEAMAGYGADTSRIITFKEGGSRGGGNAPLIWGVNPYKDDYNVSSIHGACVPFKIGSMARLSVATFPGFGNIFNTVLGSPCAFRYDYISPPQDKADLICNILLNVDSNEADNKSAFGYVYSGDPDLIDSLQEKRITILYGTHDSFMPLPYLFDFDYLLKDKEIPKKIFLGYGVGHNSEPIKYYTEDIDNTRLSLIQGNNINPHSGHIREFYMPRELVNKWTGADYKTVPIDTNYVLITDALIDQINSTIGYEDYFDANHNSSKLAFSATIPYRVVKRKPYDITLIGEEGKSWEIWCRKEDGYDIFYFHGVFGEQPTDPYNFAVYGKEYVILNLGAVDETGRYEWFFTYDGKEIPNRFTPFLDQNGYPEKAISEVLDEEPNSYWDYLHPCSTKGINHGVDQYHPLLLKDNHHPQLSSITDTSDPESKSIETLYLTRGESVSLRINASDPDNDKLVYDLRDPNNRIINHNGLDFNFNGLTGVLTLRIDEQDNADYDLRLKAIVKDGKGGRDEKPFTIKVKQHCFQLSPYKDKFYLTILPDGQIKGFGYSPESGEYLVGGWQDQADPNRWILFVDMEPSKGHSFEYGVISGYANDQGLYTYNSDGDPCEENPSDVTLIDLTGGKSGIISSLNLSGACEGNFVQGSTGDLLNTYCYKVEPYTDIISLNLEQDGRFAGHGYNSSDCSYLIGGILLKKIVNNQTKSFWALFCDFVPSDSKCNNDFGYGIIGGCDLLGSLSLYYQDGTLFNQEYISVLLNRIDCNPQTFPLPPFASGMAYEGSSAVEDPNAKLWMDVKINITEEVSPISFELDYDANNFLYSGYLPGDLASYFSQLDVTDTGLGKIKVEGELAGGIISYPLNGNLLSLGFKKRQGFVVSFNSSSYQAFEFSSQNPSVNFNSIFGDVIINITPFQPPDNEFTLDLPNGWSMISLPLIPENTYLSSLFPEAKVVYGYEKATGYKRVKQEESMEANKGYWILMDQAKTYDLTGQSIAEYSLSVNDSGWLMIGGCSSDARVLSENCVIKVIYGYDRETGYKRVLESENLKPAKGYWILLENVEDQCKLTVEVTAPPVF
ncbi:MAG: choice-of-anchor Q domain-containing protein [bacterium]